MWASARSRCPVSASERYTTSSSSIGRPAASESLAHCLEGVRAEHLPQQASGRDRAGVHHPVEETIARGIQHERVEGLGHGCTPTAWRIALRPRRSSAIA